MENSDNSNVLNLEDGQVSVPVVPEITQDLTEGNLEALVAALKSAQPSNFKHRFQGVAGAGKAKVDMSWHNGELIPTAERNKLSWEEVHASNNVIRK
jgi:hypothetical protein